MSRKKILFVHPLATIGLRIEKETKYPPMGIVFLAAVARENGYEVKILDANIEDNSWGNINLILADFKPDVVGISFTSLLAESASRVAELVKKTNNRIAVIAGGYHPTVMPRLVMENKNFDFSVVGEGEQTLMELIRELFGSRNFNLVKGLVFRRGEEVVQTERRELINDLDVLPFPAYDLLPIGKYSNLASTRKPYVTFIRSRGCPFLCTFCGVQKMFGRRYRCQSPEKTMAEIDILVKDFRVKEINFRDSDFLIDRANVEKFCQLMIKKQHNLVWTCNARVDMVNEQILSLMKRAGCRLITYGVESGNLEILNRLRKGINPDQARQAITLAKKVKIKCALDIILGGVGETQTTFRETMDFIKDTDPDYASFSYLTAFPGSDLYEEAEKRGWFLNKEKNDYSYELVNLNATGMTTDELSKLFNQAMREFYFRPSYVFKRLRNLNWPELKNNFKGSWTIIRNFVNR